MRVNTGIFSNPHGASIAPSGAVRVRGTSASSLEAST